MNIKSLEYIVKLNEQQFWKNLKFRVTLVISVENFERNQLLACTFSVDVGLSPNA